MSESVRELSIQEIAQVSGGDGLGLQTVGEFPGYVAEQGFDAVGRITTDLVDDVGNAVESLPGLLGL